jgi:hypothetical protein
LPTVYERAAPGATFGEHLHILFCCVELFLIGPYQYTQCVVIFWHTDVRKFGNSFQ